MDTDRGDNSNVTPTKTCGDTIVDDWVVESKRLDKNTKQRHQYKKRKRQKKKLGTSNVNKKEFIGDDMIQCIIVLVILMVGGPLVKTKIVHLDIG